MTEQLFIDLGFEKCFNRDAAENPGTEHDWYYYALEIGDIELITNDSRTAEENGWFCSIFDSETLKIQGGGDVEELVKILKLNTHA